MLNLSIKRRINLKQKQVLIFIYLANLLFFFQRIYYDTFDLVALLERIHLVYYKSESTVFKQEQVQYERDRVFCVDQLST